MLIPVSVFVLKYHIEHKNYYGEIEAGSGVSNCTIGMNAICFRILFGGPEVTKISGTTYYTSYNKGIQANIEDNKIKAIHFFFVDPKYKNFKGSTDRGIGISSYIEDVKRLYGNPSRIYSSTLFGNLTTLHYSYEGIRFEFVNDHLQSITIYEPAG